MKNIDLACAECGNNLAEIENLEASLVNETLAVLLEQGLYSMFLFLESKGSSRKDPAKKMGENIFSFLKDRISDIGTEDNALNSIRKNFQNDPARLFWAKDITEKALVYARYHIRTNVEGKNELESL
jgi:hypothetical protein